MKVGLERFRVHFLPGALISIEGAALKLKVIISHAGITFKKPWLNVVLKCLFVETKITLKAFLGFLSRFLGEQDFEVKITSRCKFDRRKSSKLKNYN